MRANDTIRVVARRPPPRAGVTSRVLLGVGLAVLAATVGVVAVASVRHLAGAHGPVLPVSWCRSGSMTVLAPLTGVRWFTSWQADPIALAVVAGLALLYSAGVVAVSRRERRRWPLRRSASFASGLLVCVIATCGPIGVYDMAMFSTHMLGHLALVMVAPALLVVGRPLTLALHATRNPWHTRIKRVTRGRLVSLWFCPPVALAGYIVVIVGTHLTGLMDDIMSRAWAGQLEHAVYLLVGCQLFALVLGDEPLRWRLSMPAKQLLLAVAMAVDTFTGVILLQTTNAISMTGMSPQHVDPLGETHLGGAIMWVGGDGVMAAAMVLVLLAWLRQPDYRRRDSRSWFERARRANLAGHTVSAGSAASEAIRDVDSDDRARSDYNAWLAQLAGHQRDDPPPR